MKDLAINASNYLAPISQVWSHQPKSMLMTQTKVLNIYMKGVNFTTDYGWALSNQETVSGIGLEST